jgi:hypothetical protein
MGPLISLAAIAGTVGSSFQLSLISRNIWRRFWKTQLGVAGVAQDSFLRRRLAP